MGGSKLVISLLIINRDGERNEFVRRCWRFNREITREKISRRRIGNGYRNIQLSDLVASESTSVLFQKETSKGDEH